MNELKDLMPFTVFFDSCAFDPKLPNEDQAVKKIEEWDETDWISIEIAHSTKTEIEHPRTPKPVKGRAMRCIFTCKVGLTDEELKLKRKIELLLSGNGKVEKMKKDACHIFECSKYGPGRFFLTMDKRILERKSDMKNLCGVNVYKPSEFVGFFEKALNNSYVSSCS